MVWYTDSATITTDHSSFFTTNSSSTIHWPRILTSSTTVSKILTWPVYDTSTNYWPVTWEFDHARPRPLNHRQTLRRAEFAPDWANVTPEELTALRLLRGLVQDVEWRRYLKDGALQAQGPSGLAYRIRRDTRQRIQVRYQGQHIADLCIHLKNWSSKPPTDEVVAKLLMAEMDELDLWRRANITWRITKAVPPLEHLGLKPTGGLQRVAA